MSRKTRPTTKLIFPLSNNTTFRSIKDPCGLVEPATQLQKTGRVLRARFLAFRKGTFAHSLFSMFQIGFSQFSPFIVEAKRVGRRQTQHSQCLHSQDERTLLGFGFAYLNTFNEELFRGSLRARQTQRSLCLRGHGAGSNPFRLVQ